MGPISIPHNLSAEEGRHNRARWAAALLLCLALLPFAAVRNYPHVHDDHVLRGPGSLATDPQVDLGQLLAADFFGTRGQLRGQTGFWRPLILLSFRAEARLAGRSQAGYVWLGHVLTLLCHAAAVLALWRLACRIGLGETAALLAAGLFALHPVHVESVAWASGRTDSLPTALGFAALSLWLGNVRSAGRVVFAGLLLTAALLCKETALLLVLLAPVLGLAKGRSLRASVAPSALALVLALGSRALVFGLLPGGDPAAYSGPVLLAHRWFTWASALPSMLRLLLWPGQPTPIHPLAEAGGLWAPGVIPGLIVFGLLLAGMLLAWRWRSAAGLLTTGLVLGTCTMLAPWTRVPTGFPEVAGPLYERYLYAAAAAPALLIGWALARRLNGRVWLAPGLLVLAGLGLGPVVARRARMWSSDEAFALAGLSQAPDSPDLWTHLGLARLERYRKGGAAADGEQALQAFEQALRFDPEHRLAALDRFITLAGLGRHNEAARAGEGLMQRWPDDPGVLHNLAAWMVGLGQDGRAAALYERELAAGQALPGAEQALAACRERLHLAQQGEVAGDGSAEAGSAPPTAAPAAPAKSRSPPEDGGRR